MYRLLKEGGNNMMLTVEDTTKKTSCEIGKLNCSILDLLEKEEGITFEGDLKMTDKWTIELHEETAKTLLNNMMRGITKPKRDQSKQTLRKEHNKKVDMMDVLYGLAEYK